MYMWKKKLDSDLSYEWFFPVFSSGNAVLFVCVCRGDATGQREERRGDRNTEREGTGKGTDVQFKKPKANTQVIKYRIHGATGDKKVHW